MSAVIRWEDPDSVARTNGLESWRPVADELRAHPHEWALIYEDDHIRANKVAGWVKSGREPFGPGRQFEAKMRTVNEMVNGKPDKVVRVYARYVGLPSGAAEVTP